MLIVEFDDDRRGVDAVAPPDRDLAAISLKVGEDLIGDDVLIPICQGDQFRRNDLNAITCMRRMNIVVGVEGGWLEGVVGRRVVVATVLGEVIAAIDRRVVGDTDGGEIRA